MIQVEVNRKAGADAGWRVGNCFTCFIELSWVLCLAAARPRRLPLHFTLQVRSGSGLFVFHRHGSEHPFSNDITGWKSNDFFFCSSETLSMQGLNTQHNGLLARELCLHQGGVRDEASEDGRVDGECGEVHCQNHGRQGLHFLRVQERKRHLQRKIKLRFFG